MLSGIILMALIVAFTLLAPSPDKWVGRAAVFATFAIMAWRRYLCMALYARQVFGAALSGAVLVPVTCSLAPEFSAVSFSLWLYPLLVSALMTASFYGLTKGTGRMA